VRDSWGTIIDVQYTYLNLAFGPDAHTAFSFAAEAKSKGLGVTAGVGFGFTTAGEVDLENAFTGVPTTGASFSNERYDHSGQFALGNMERQYYWNLVMKRFGLTPWTDLQPDMGGRV